MVGGLCVVGAASASQGDLATGFGAGGIADVGLGTDGSIESAVLTTDGGVIGAGSNSSGALLVKVKADGTPDTSFGVSGKVTTSYGVAGGYWNAVASQSDGKIVVAGRDPSGGGKIVLRRFTSAGSSDTSFGTSGITVVTFGGSGESVAGLAVGGDDSVYVVGYSTVTVGSDNLGMIGVAKYTAGGSVADGYATQGAFVTACGQTTALSALSIAVDSLGGVFAGGGTGDYQGCLVRLTPSGTLDATFSGDGIVWSAVGSFDRIVIDGSSRVVAVQAELSDFSDAEGGSFLYYTVTRYTSTGVLDTTFSSDGMVTMRTIGHHLSRPRVALQSDGKIVLSANYNFVDSDTSMSYERGIVRRLTTTGLEDTAYLTGLYTDATSPVVVGEETGATTYLCQLLVSTDGIFVVGVYDAMLDPREQKMRVAKIVNSGLRSDPVTARVDSASDMVVTGESVEIDASTSTSTSGVMSFAWDIDGDGTFERDSGTTANTTASWDTVGTKSVTVQVTSGDGTTSEASVDVEVRRAPPAGESGVSINDGGSYTNTKSVVLSVVWPKFATNVRVSNDGGFSAARTQTFTLSETINWDLDDSVTGLYTKVVYVRFGGSGIDTSKTYQDDIILDTTAPTITSTKATTSSSIMLQTQATDDLSGVDQMQVQLGSATITRAYATTVAIKPADLGLAVSTSSVSSAGVVQVKVRVSDKAGNWTGWRSVTVPKVTLKPVLLKVGRTAKFSTLAKAAGLTVASTDKLSVSSKTPTVCKVRSGLLAGLKRGTCRITVTAKPKKGKSRTKSLTINL